MNITNDYQKRKGQITPYPKVVILEPKRKYLESNSPYSPSNFCIYSEYLERYRKLKNFT